MQRAPGYKTLNFLELQVLEKYLEQEEEVEEEDEEEEEEVQM